MNSIAKKEQRNRALNTHWGTECGCGVRRVPDQCSANAPDTRVATTDRYLTAIEAIVATADAEATVIAGRPGYVANSPAVCLVTARVSEDGWFCDARHDWI
jgi:hypothetical protein